MQRFRLEYIIQVQQVKLGRYINGSVQRKVLLWQVTCLLRINWLLCLRTNVISRVVMVNESMRYELRTA